MNTYKNIDELIKDLENFLEDNEYRLTYNGIPNDKVAAISENNCWLIINTITKLQQEKYELERDNKHLNGLLDTALNEQDRLQNENERLKKALNCKEYFSSTMPEDTEFVILTKANYDRQQKDIQLELIDYKSRCEKAIELLELKQLRYLNEDDYRICTLDLQEVKDILQNGDVKNGN